MSRIFGTGKAVVRKYLLKYNGSLRAVWSFYFSDAVESFSFRNSDINVWYHKYDFSIFHISLNKVIFQTQYKGQQIFDGLYNPLPPKKVSTNPHALLYI